MRERSVRSVPMQVSQTRASRSSLNAGTPDSLSDNESSIRTPIRKMSTSSIYYKSTAIPGICCKICLIKLNFAFISKLHCKTKLI